MKLYIDTTSKENIKIKLDEKEFMTDSLKERSQRLLPFLIETLDKRKLGIKDIDEIEINVSGGSFTGIRVGLSVANILGWLGNIPVNGKNITSEGSVVAEY